MKIRTVTALAALGMMLTSLAVRSLTKTADARPGDRGSGERWNDRRGPRSADGRALSFESRLGHTRLAADRTEETFVLVNVRGDAQARGRDARRHLAIVVDRSGSMQGQKIDSAIAAAKGAIGRLAEADLVSVVDYATTASILVSPAEVGSARDRANRAVSALRAEGGTCISCALERSGELVGNRSGFVNRVLLLSDGEATVGATSLDGMRQATERVRLAGASVTTIGIGVDYNERMMAGIARETNGRHHFAETTDALARIFDRELSGLERSVARDARLELELAPGVELSDVSGQSFSREGDRAVITLGSLHAGEERSVLAKLRVRGGGVGERPVATARLRYEDLGSGKSEGGEERLVAVFTADGSRSRIDPVVEERLERSSTVTALDDANDLFQRGDVEAARTRVGSKLTELKKGRPAALAAAPAEKRAALAQRFDAQEAALGQAASGFAEPPSPVAASSPASTKAKALLKRNQVEASELSR